MLRKRRRDWFPIVATDLFCGVLAAVIILDAVSPREVSGAAQVVYMEIAFPDRTGLSGYGDRCQDVGRVVFSFMNDSKRVNTLIEGGTDGKLTDGICRLQSLFPAIHFDREFERPSVLIAEYPGDVDALEVTITVPGLEPLICSRRSPKCLVK